MENSSVVKAALSGKCPRCRKGDMFEDGAISLNPLKMHKDCPVCNLHYEIEPGFFWISMYISYGFSVGFILTVVFGSVLFWKGFNPLDLIYIIVPGIVILSPFSFRYSRILVLYVFSGVKYDPTSIKNNVSA